MGSDQHLALNPLPLLSWFVLCAPTELSLERVRSVSVVGVVGLLSYHRALLLFVCLFVCLFVFNFMYSCPVFQHAMIPYNAIVFCIN